MKGRALLSLLFCICLLWGCSAVQGVSQVQTTPAPTPTVPAQPPRTATSAPTPTPTLTPSPVPTVPTPTITQAAIPTLGDTLTAWDAYYRQGKIIPSTQMHLKQYADTMFSVVVGYDPNQHGRVFTLTITAFQVWSADDMHMRRQAEKWLPHDAMNIQRMVTGQGYEEKWISKKLASSFPASYFLNNDGNPVTPGTFNIFYVFGANKSTFDHATMSVSAAYGQ